MAKKKNIVFVRTVCLMTVAAMSASASELWQYSNPLFESLDLSAGTSYAAPAVQQSWGLQSTVSSAQSTTAQWAAPAPSSDAWFTTASWSTGSTASTQQQTVLADDVFRGFLFTDNTSSNTATNSASNGAWFSGFFADSTSSSAASNQSSGGFWNSYNGWDTGSNVAASNNSANLGWWNSFDTYGTVNNNAQTVGGGAWWNSYGGFGGGGGGTSSDTAACNVVSTWAGTSDWRSFFDGGSAPAAPTTTCSPQQASTITNLTPTNNLVATNAPIGSGTDPVVIEVAVDNPEPGTWLMMLGGLGALGYMRRRKA